MVYFRSDLRLPPGALPAILEHQCPLLKLIEKYDIRVNNPDNLGNSCRYQFMSSRGRAYKKSKFVKGGQFIDVFFQDPRNRAYESVDLPVSITPAILADNHSITLFMSKVYHDLAFFPVRFSLFAPL
jgi:hypothetical protein